MGKKAGSSCRAEVGACWAHNEHAAEVGTRFDGWDRVRLGVGNCGGRASWACCAALVGAHRRVGAGGIPSPRWEPRSLCPRSVPKPTEQRSGAAEGGERRRGPGAPGRGRCGRTCSLPLSAFLPPPPHLPSPRLRGRARSVLFRSAAPGAVAAARAQPRARRAQSVPRRLLPPGRPLLGDAARRAGTRGCPEPPPPPRGPLSA